ncbi:hypothetical protein LPB73_12790 [Tardiphaga sp. 37S4]|uniref:hypothetical protein n=1 Tax=Tardiphaga sp. 37S4 TaxID=1404741 RepID=UPI001E4F2985|nr:hypothetical protein [Tardiphaga sp. 37S4]UFS78193.1 hypothetical protein LPB73_12790 [Tardiphaga sp. 37S4]
MIDTPTAPPAPLPAPPDLFTIPTALVDQWSEIPGSDRLNFPLTRQDIDHLLLGLLRSLEAQATLDRVITDWSNGRVDEANRALNDFRRQNADAQNNIRQLVAAIMASALRERKNA